MKSDALTTGQAAKACGVSIRTLKRWLDRGDLVGYRLPGSGEWRIPRFELVRFMERHGIPLEQLEAEEPRRRILVIEDDPQVSELIRSALSGDSRLQVEYTTTGYKACLKAGLFQPDLVVIGLMAPAMAGLECARVLRENPATRQIKILLTGYSDPECIANMETLGDGHLFRPVEAELLVETTYKMVGLVSPGSRESGSPNTPEGTGPRARKRQGVD